jgi:hypothetical protein
VTFLSNQVEELNVIILMVGKRVLQ